MNRVVVTGLGVISPIGNNSLEFQKNIINGVNGIKTISHFDTNEFKVKIAGEVNIDLIDYFSSKELNKIDRFTAFSIIAADEAIKNSNLNNKNNKNNIGVIIGSGIGGINTLEKQHKRLLRHPKKVSPYFIPTMISDIAAGHISIKHGYKGLNYSVVSACASGSHAIGDAYKMIKYGDADAIVAGGSEAAISPISIAGFSNMKALTQNIDINTACRPFDKDRDGFVMGEGSGIIVLESLTSAQERNATIHAELIGYGASADAHHLTQPDPEGNGAFRSMEIALKDANISSKNIDYINAHGTSTKFNDKIETHAIKKLFKKHAYNISISSTKSMTGHLLGAAGGIESIACIQSIENSIIPPTINYSTPDKDCDLDYTPNIYINKTVDYALSNTFGFGGHNASLIFKKFSE